MSTNTPQDSLQNYFDDLLLDGSEPIEVQQPPEPKPQPKKIEKPETAPPAVNYQERQREKEAQAKAKLAKLLSTAPAEVKAAPVVQEAVEQKTAEQETKEQTAVAPEAIAQEVAVEAEPIVEVEVVTEASQAEDLMASLAWLENGRPRWAQERFDVLLFSVSGLTLAVPLIALGQIQPLTDELTPLFGQADWFMGLQPTPMGKIRTVNTAKFVMPERYDEAFLESAKYVISIDGLPWGLAVDAVNQPITLEPEDVKWRGERSKRAWLAGTVKQHMCALIDIPMMGQLLENEDHGKKT